MRTVLSIAFALLGGLLMTRLVKRLHLPDVTAYLVAGLLMGPCFLGKLGIPGIGFQDYAQLEELSLVSDVVLGFIAFSIGNEFRLSALKKTGKQAFIIGVAQALAAALLVDGALLLLHVLFPALLSVPAAIVLGAIATATAPAATLMVVRQYKAKGKLTDLLLPIVALDDAVGLVVFALSFGIAKAQLSGQVDVISLLVNPLVEIVASLLAGALAGFFLTHLEKLFHSNTNRLVMTIAFVFMMVGLSMLELPIGPVKLGFSSLLVCMMLGTAFCNLCPLSEELMGKADRWTAPLLVLFFVISGAELELGMFSSPLVLLVGAVYILFRSVGKYLGARYSAMATKCDKTVVDHLGITLLPQAGVALGMCVSAQSLGSDGVLIRNIILFSVLIYELFGPLATKRALTKAGDIVSMPKELAERRANKLLQAEVKPLALRLESFKRRLKQKNTH